MNCDGFGIFYSGIKTLLPYHPLSTQLIHGQGTIQGIDAKHERGIVVFRLRRNHKGKNQQYTGYNLVDVITPQQVKLSVLTIGLRYGTFFVSERFSLQNIFYHGTLLQASVLNAIQFTPSCPLPLIPAEPQLAGFHWPLGTKWFTFNTARL